VSFEGNQFFKYDPLAQNSCSKLICGEQRNRTFTMLPWTHLAKELNKPIFNYSPIIIYIPLTQVLSLSLSIEGEQF
jgi:hypothetical protein